MTYPLTVQGSGSAVYEIKETETGGLWCTCPGWKFAKGTPKECKHIRAHRAGQGVGGASKATAQHVDAGSTESARRVHPTSNGEVAGSNPATSSRVAPSTYIQPMKLEEADQRDAVDLVASPHWVMEQKVDGARCVITVDANGVRFGNGSGEPLRHSTSTQHFPALGAALPAPTPGHGHYTIDGELLWTGEYWAFDMLAVGGGNLTPLPLAQRREALEAFFDGLDSDHVRLLPQASTVEEKQRLLAHVKETGGEGVVLKDSRSPYVTGSRTRHQLKIKFRKTVDCIVIERNTKGHENATLAVHESGSLRKIGNCSMIGKPDAQVGDVVEVAYLYATDDLTLYQPSLVRIRTDKAAEECLLDQLTPVSKEVLDALV